MWQSPRNSTKETPWNSSSVLTNVFGAQQVAEGIITWDIWDINVKVSVVSGNPFHPWGKPQNLKARNPWCLAMDAMAMISCLGSTWIWVLRSWAVADSFFCTDLSAKPCSKPLRVDDYRVVTCYYTMLYYPILEDIHNPFLEILITSIYIYIVYTYSIYIYTHIVYIYRVYI